MSSNMTVTDRIAEKLKSEAASEFFTEEDLFELTKNAIEKAFFTTKTVVDYHHTRKEIDPPIVEHVKTYLGDRIREAATKCADDWIAANPDKFQVLIEEAFNKAPAEILSNTFAKLFDGVINQMQSQTQAMMISKLQSLQMR